MESNKDLESPEVDTKIDFQSLQSKFERPSGNISLKGSGAQTPTRSYGPAKTNTVPDNSKKKETCSPGLKRRSKSHVLQAKNTFCRDGSTRHIKLAQPIEQAQLHVQLFSIPCGIAAPGLLTHLETAINNLYLSQMFVTCQINTYNLAFRHCGETLYQKLFSFNALYYECCHPGNIYKCSDLPTGETKMANYESLKVFQMPVCLIETDFNGKLYVHQDVLAQISQIDHPLNIVCIAGSCRTGKSYLLTRLAGRNKGFALGSTIESKTKGIWAWCRPHPIKKDQVLLLLDTEGLSDIEKGDKQNDNQILSLGILLSSTMVYNILGKFSNDDMDTLSFVTEISKKIKFSDEMSIEESSSNFDRVFPTFIVTLRDFCLKLMYQGKKITSDEYLEKVCLNFQPETSEKNLKNNRARRCLMEYFKTRKCFTFDRPGKTDLLSELETLQDHDLDKDFIKDSKLFTDYVYNKCPPKQMSNGQPVNGRRFVIMAKQYVDAIRNGKVPNIEDTLTTMVHLENTRAIEKSVEIYVCGMDKLEYPTPDNITLSAAHERSFKVALDFFRVNSMYDEEGNYYNSANEQIGEKYEHFRTRDQEESAKMSQKKLENMGAGIKQKVKDGLYYCKDGYKLYLKDMEKLETDYHALTGLGCKKIDMLDKYHRDNASRRDSIMQADKTLTKKEKEMEAERQKTAAAERQQQEEKRLREKQERLRNEEQRIHKKDMENQKKKHEEEKRKEIESMRTVLNQRLEAKLNAELLQKELSEYHQEGTISLIGRGLRKIFWK